MADREIINDKSYIGFQSAFGAAVDADKQLPDVSIIPDIDGPIRPIETTGEEFPTGTQHGPIISPLAIEGTMSFVSLTYLLEAFFGTVTPTTVGGTGRQRVYTPSTTKPRYFRNDFGDSTRFRRAIDCFLTALHMHATLEETTVDGEGIGQQLLDSVLDTLTLASSPTLVAQKTPDPLKCSVRRATSLSGLDTASAFTRAFVWDVNIAGRWGPLHAMWPALTGKYDGTLRKRPGTRDGMIQVGADDDGWGYWTRAKSNSTDYLRFEVTGDAIQAGTAEVQTITFTGGPTAGNTTITFPAAYSGPAQTAAVVAFNATAAAMQDALQALTRIGAGGVTVTRAGVGSAADPYVYTCTFAADLGNVPQFTSTHTFTGGTTPTTTHATSTPGVDPIKYLIRVDMAVAARSFPTKGDAPGYAEGLDVLDIELLLEKTSTLNGVQITVINETVTL